ncbi:hypothetical protein QFC22_006283 [Naganishia vaughanmartiniae]|uniref:Uncharacterized protein n=1 Tax=Naganishia vaughanmartiniae TaxID=1424756 RepID=A0ACC2WNZ8_9TREE|nr:hypothetical protein QFC22_006283 [Naganishia vaughanmartiniae]
MSLPFLSRNVTNAIAPPIPRAQAWARTYPATNEKPLLNLSQGVPGDPPHQVLVDELVQVVKEGKGVGYGPILGEEALRRGLRREMGRVYEWEGADEEESRGVEEGGNEDAEVGEEGSIVSNNNENGKGGAASIPPTWDEIGITSGCNQAFFGIMLTLCERGDKVLIPVPWYFNMLMTFQVLGITPVPLPLSPTEGFTPSVTTARKILESESNAQTGSGEQGSGRVKAIILVTPNNPTGCTYPPELIEEFADLARDYGTCLVIDETYRDFIPPSGSVSGGTDTSTLPTKSQPVAKPGKPHSLFQRPDWRNHVISVGSFSKSYKIPGHRLGFVVAGQEVMRGLTTVSDCIQICAPRPPQIALSAVLPQLRDDLAQTSARLGERLKLFKRVVESVPGWRVEAQGGFFSYVRHPFRATAENDQEEGDGGWIPSEQISKILAERCGVLTLPGAFFMPTRDDPLWTTLTEAGSVLVHDRWIRFAVANVDDEVVRRVPERLEQLNGIMVKEYGYELAP